MGADSLPRRLRSRCGELSHPAVGRLRAVQWPDALAAGDLLVPGLWPRPSNSDGGPPTDAGDAGTPSDSGSSEDGGPLLPDGGRRRQLVAANCSGVVPTYAQLTPVFTRACVVCHDDAAGGPWPLTTYQHVADWQDQVRSEILNCTMPPLDAGIPITWDERQAIFTWVRCGRPK